MPSSETATRQHASFDRPARPTGRNSRGRASSARAPRVDTWWKTPKGRVPFEPADRYKTISDVGTLPNLAVSELNYSSWASPSASKPKKLAPKELRQSVERLSTPYYSMRPMSAPVTRSAPLHDGLQETPGPAAGTNLEYAFQIAGTKARKLTPTAQQELVDRLYKVKEMPEIPEKECVTLKYNFNPGAREGAGGYEEKWEPIKIYNQQESIEALSNLKKRNDEKIAKLHAKLEAKYLAPLCTVKKVSLKDEEVKEKIELLFRGQGTVKRT